MDPKQNATNEKRLSVVFKVLGGSRFNYDNADVTDFATNEFDRLLREDALRQACVLQPEDTCAVVEANKSFSVIEPQQYSRVTTLDRSHYMFEEAREPDSMCCGLFYEHDGNAVSGSGGDLWFKLCDELVEFCTTVDRQACALEKYLEKTDHTDEYEYDSYNREWRIKNRIEETDKEMRLVQEEVERMKRNLKSFETAVDKHQEEKSKLVAELAKQLDLGNPTAAARKTVVAKKRRTGDAGGRA